MSYLKNWLNNKGRVADIKKEGKTIYHKAYIKDIDINNRTLFILSNEGREITMLLTAGVNIELYPIKTPFKVEAEVC